MRIETTAEMKRKSVTQPGFKEVEDVVAEEKVIRKDLRYVTPSTSRWGRVPVLITR